MSDIIKHKDPFWGEIKLKEVANISISFEDNVTYYILETGEYNKPRLKDGVWYKDKHDKIHHMTGDQVECIYRIYDKLTRID
jgi:hypothetical protein